MVDMRPKWAHNTDIATQEHKMPQVKSQAVLAREAVKAGGYPYWCSYNDKRKDGTRRIKCMQNGYDYGSPQYKTWEKNILRELKLRGVKYKSAEFQALDRCGYGGYTAFVIVL